MTFFYLFCYFLLISTARARATVSGMGLRLARFRLVVSDNVARPEARERLAGEWFCAESDKRSLPTLDSSGYFKLTAGAPSSRRSSGRVSRDPLLKFCGSEPRLHFCPGTAGGGMEPRDDSRSRGERISSRPSHPSSDRSTGSSVALECQQADPLMLAASHKSFYWRLPRRTRQYQP